VLAATTPLPGGVEKAISSLFRFFAKERPANPAPLPSWDLGIVLRGFTQQPFVPLQAMDLGLLTKKTLFLVFLAAGARRSEVLALSRRVSFRQRPAGCEAVLSPVPGFVPKSRRGVSANRPFVIKALPVNPGSGEESALCPVKTLQAFLTRTERLYGSSPCLFPSVAEPSRPLTTHGLKALIVDVISTAYKAAGREKANTVMPNLHDLRRLSFSLASAGGGLRLKQSSPRGGGGTTRRLPTTTFRMWHISLLSGTIWALYRSPSLLPPLLTLNTSPLQGRTDRSPGLEMP
jgi:hypothetical protein